MSLKYRLAFIFSVCVFIILVASALSISFLNENFRREEFNKRLILEASESNRIFISQPQLNREIIDELDENALNSLNEEHVIILDSAYRLLYASPNSRIPFLPFNYYRSAKQDKEHYFTLDKRQGVVLYSDRMRPHYVIASAYDLFGYRKSDNLRLLLSASVLGGLLLSALIAFFYVTQSLKPLENLKEQIETITEANLKERIAVSGNNEVSQIGKQFNAMLDRLEQAFDQRKNFVQHASHELRTPLANMLSQTEAALNKSLSTEEYKRILELLKEDQQDMIDLINSLLTLSRYEKLPSVQELSPIRIDEILFQTTDFINQIWPNAVITVDFETMPEDERLLIVHGNESLIKSAVQNLVKNAIQYSDNQKVKITISVNEKGIRLCFENEGKQLSPDEQAKLFIPFFRGENSMYRKGYGLGLSIVERIINLHRGSVKYQAVDENINRFIVHLPA